MGHRTDHSEAPQGVADSHSRGYTPSPARWADQTCAVVGVTSRVQLVWLRNSYGWLNRSARSAVGCLRNFGNVRDLNIRKIRQIHVRHVGDIDDNLGEAGAIAELIGLPCRDHADFVHLHLHEIELLTHFRLGDLLPCMSHRHLALGHRNPLANGLALNFLKSAFGAVKSFGTAAQHHFGHGDVLHTTLGDALNIGSRLSCQTMCPPQLSVLICTVETQGYYAGCQPVPSLFRSHLPLLNLLCCLRRGGPEFVTSDNYANHGGMFNEVRKRLWLYRLRQWAKKI